MTDVFISDLHLSEDQPAISQGFLWFLDTQLADATSLYILGDFFELWIGDDYRSPFYEEIISALARLKIPLYLMHGNRDFLLGQAFCNEVGATLLDDPVIVDLHGEKVLLMHGDSLCTDDVEYMQVRGLLRSEAFQTDFLSKSPEERLAFAQSARQQSQAHTGEAASEIMDVNQSEVTRIMAEFGVQTLIHGHTHRPAEHEVTLDSCPGLNGSGRRLVLGDWSDTSGWKISATKEGLALVQFNLGEAG